MIASAVLTGFATGMSLLVVIGAQNAFVLRQGLRGEHVLWVVIICSLSDIALESAGVAGLGTISRLAGWILPAMRWFGVAFLVIYGAMTLRNALKHSTLAPDQAGTAMSRRRVVLTCLALTWLNPHVYLDTVLLIGSIALSHVPVQWWFLAGSLFASCCWFVGIGYGAKWLRPLFASPKSWRILDIGIAVVMWTVAVSLILSR